MVILTKGVPVAQLVKNLGRRPWFNSWFRKIRWRRDSIPTPVFLGFLVAQLVKKLPAMQETWVWENPLEKGTAIHSSILAWRIPWTV